MVNKIVKGFLEFQQYSSDQMFDKFLSLDNVICICNPNVKKERYLYRQGTAENDVLLIAWTNDGLQNGNANGYTNQMKREKHNTFIGESSNIRTGVDNKVGCAMLWTLRNFKYSLLVLNEPDGLDFFSKNKDLVNKVIEHRFIIQLNQNGDLNSESIEQDTIEFKKTIMDSSNK